MLGPSCDGMGGVNNLLIRYGLNASFTNTILPSVPPVSSGAYFVALVYRKRYNADIDDRL